MLDDTPEDPKTAVWMAMADHYLDTETRQDIPWTAWRCSSAGLSVDEARDVWCFEVTPAVGHNLWNPVGEWAGWPKDWLIAEITRRAWPKNLLTYVGYRCLAHFNHGVWVSIERCMHLIASFDELDRPHVVRAMVELGRHYFDFCGHGLSKLEPRPRDLVRQLYPDAFEHVMAPATCRGDRLPAGARVSAALEELP